MDKEILVICEKMQGSRLDVVLAQYFAEHSRSYFQYLIEIGAVLVNGQTVKKRTEAKEGDEVEVCFVIPPEISPEPECIPLDILYEDDEILAINKPPGMVVHPAPGHTKGTFVNALLHHCGSLRAEEGSLRPGIVHRLDKETSGVLLAAKTRSAHQRLVEQFAARALEKKYVALCVGHPKEQTIRAPIGRHPVRRKEMHVDVARGKEAHTELKVLAQQENFSFVELRLITGRTHQIRVHLKHIGCPILGDATYGSTSVNKKFKIDRQLLHAHTMHLVHPTRGTPLFLEAPLPNDITKRLVVFGLAQ